MQLLLFAGCLCLSGFTVSIGVCVCVCVFVAELPSLEREKQHTL
jgi:hypothetical protein